MISSTKMTNPFFPVENCFLFLFFIIKYRGKIIEFLCFWFVATDKSHFFYYHVYLKRTLGWPNFGLCISKTINLKYRKLQINNERALKLKLLYRQKINCHENSYHDRLINLINFYSSYRKFYWLYLIENS